MFWRYSQCCSWPSQVKKEGEASELEQRSGNSKDRKTAETLCPSRVPTNSPFLTHWVPSQHDLSYIILNKHHFAAPVGPCTISLYLATFVGNRVVFSSGVTCSGACPCHQPDGASSLSGGVCVVLCRAVPWVACGRQTTFRTSPSSVLHSILLVLYGAYQYSPFPELTFSTFTRLQHPV